MDSYVIISTERLALQVFGRCPIALCATCDIDGCGKMSLQANIFPYGRITSRTSKALKMPRVSENIESQYCGDIPPPALLRYHRSSVNGSNILWYERRFILMRLFPAYRRIAFCGESGVFGRNPWNFPGQQKDRGAMAKSTEIS